MTQDDFHKLVHFVMDSPAHPPEKLFIGGMDSWHARARLAHFLAMKGIDKTSEALELFHSVVDADIDDEKAEDVEEKVFALQRLSSLEKELGQMMTLCAISTRPSNSPNQPISSTNISCAENSGLIAGISCTR